MVVVEKGIPIPGKRGNKHEYPFNKMEIGDSFLEEDKKLRNIVQSAAFDYGKNNNMKFTTRDVGNGIRIWRIQ